MADDFNIDDLIGHGSQLPRPPKRADSSQDDIDAVVKAIAGGRGSFVDAGDLKRPVTINFLAVVFDMDAATVKRRLTRVRPVAVGGTGLQPRNLYDFKEAVSYLVPPKIDLDAYIRSIDPSKLPNHLNKAYWEAQTLKLKYKLAAKEAWHSTDVLEVFGIVFMLIKDRVQLWAENMREVVKLDDGQFAKFSQMTDDLQLDLHEQLLKIPESRSTGSMAAAVDDVAVVDVSDDAE
jgi:hypothetical protein